MHTHIVLGYNCSSIMAELKKKKPKKKTPTTPDQKIGTFAGSVMALSKKQDLEWRPSSTAGADSKCVTGWRQHTGDVCRRLVERLLYARAAPTWCVSATKICSASVKMGPSAIYNLYTGRTWSFETEISHAAAIFC